jgi:predicted alpha/beta-hydrolase family hydrolase
MAQPRILLAAGASGGEAGMTPYLRGLTARGLPAEFVALPRGTAERALPAYRAALAAAPGGVIGGQSFGGRVASLVAADVAPAGLVLLCYPLHPPGRTERWVERTSHWERIGCPVLLLSGDRDPFAQIGLLRQAVDQLANAELHVYAGIGHGLKPVLDDAVERTAAFARSIQEPVHSAQ